MYYYVYNKYVPNISKFDANISVAITLTRYSFKIYYPVLQLLHTNINDILTDKYYKKQKRM